MKFSYNFTEQYFWNYNTVHASIRLRDWKGQSAYSSPAEVLIIETQWFQMTHDRLNFLEFHIEVSQIALAVDKEGTQTLIPTIKLEFGTSSSSTKTIIR